MNILLEVKKEKVQNKKSSVKAIMSFRRQLKSIDQLSQQAVISQQQKVSAIKPYLLSQNKSKDFTTIFAKQKRCEQSGYKQIYLNESAVIKVKQQVKPICKYENSRRYEIKLKNIAKLRKRHSLQPINLKSYERKKQSQSSKQSANQNQSKINSQRNISQVSLQTNKHMSSEKIFLSTEPIAQFSQRMRPKKLNRIIKIHEEIIMPKLHQIQYIPQDIMMIHKPNLTQIKKSARIKVSFAEKKKQVTLQDELLQRTQQTSQLHGWSTASFYPKKVLPFLNGPQK